MGLGDWETGGLGDWETGELIAKLVVKTTNCLQFRNE
jgi:hypothetical protein